MSTELVVTLVVGPVGPVIGGFVAGCMAARVAFRLYKRQHWDKKRDASNRSEMAHAKWELAARQKAKEEGKPFIRF